MRRKSYRRSGLLVLGVLLAVASIILWIGVEDVWARAGGGGGFGGGGGGGGFGGGGGGFGGGGFGGGRGYGGGRHSEGGDLLFVWLFVQHPFIGFPLVGVGITLAILANVHGVRRHRAGVVRRGAVACDRQRTTKAVNALQGKDAAFDPDRFAEAVETAFVKIQQAWCAQNLQSVQHFISDGVHERFSLQIEEQKALGYRDYMEQIEVQSVLIEEARVTDLFDTITVRIKASAVDYRMGVKGKRISGSRQPQAFTEFWTFLRRGQARSCGDRRGLLEGNCPNCGASVQINQFGRCEYCDASLKSGEHDWVLTEITQGGEWMPKAQSLPGVAALQQDDPAFSVQHLEDRVSVMFWRRDAAGRTASIEPLNRIASPEYVKRFARTAANGVRPASGKRVWYGECVVGAVECLGVLRGEAMDQAFVSIQWSGGLCLQDARGYPVPLEDKVIFRSLYVLGRNSGVASSAESIICSAHCPNCGAAETGGVGGACDHCGTLLNDGSRDWILLDVLAFHSNEASGQLRAMRDQGRKSAAEGNVAQMGGSPPNAGVVAWMARTMLSDGHIDDREKEVLASVAAKCMIPPKKLDTIIQAVAQGNAEVSLPDDHDEARQWLSVMANVALADGKIVPAEKNLLLSVGERIGLSRYDVVTLVKQEHARMLREARDSIRWVKATK